MAPIFLYFRALFSFASLLALPLAALGPVVLFNDTSDWYHWGCTGTSTALKEGIQRLGVELQAFPIQTTYALKEVPPFEAFDDPEAFDRFCEANPEVAAAIREAEAVVITGEGTLHDLRDGPRALLYLVHSSKHFLSKHVEIVNHSAYPKDDPLLSSHFAGNFKLDKGLAASERERAEQIYSRLYGALDFVAIREPCSRRAMKQIGISSTAAFDCLPLYIRDHYSKGKVEKSKNTLLVAGSVAFSEEGVDQIGRYIEKMAQNGFNINVLVGAAAFPAKDDFAFIQSLKAHCRADWTLVTAHSLEEWLDAIHRATLLVSGRFHHSIAAFCLDTPFIALNSNTHKVHGICALLGQAEPLLFSDPQLLEQLLARTQSTLDAPVTQNEREIRKLCRLAERNFDGLKVFLSTPVSAPVHHVEAKEGRAS